MAERKYKSANVATQTDTFGAWVDRTNQIVFDMSEIVVTAQQNTVGGATSGNVVITSNVYNQDTAAWVNSTGGILQSNTFAALNGLRGGNVQASNTLLIVSNTNIQNNLINAASNSTVNSIRTTGSYVDIQSANLFVNNTLLQVKSNVHINSTSSNVSINSAAMHVTGTTFDINSTTVDMDGTTLTADYDDITVTANDITFKSNSTISVIDINGDGTSSSVTLAGNLVTVDSDESQFNANVTFGSSTDDTVTFTSLVDTGITPTSNALSLGLTSARWNLNSNTVNVSNTLSVTGNASFASDVDLGNADSDTITINGKVDTNIIPTANAKVLGAVAARWDINAEDINASNTLLVTGTGDFSNTLDVVGAGTFSNTVNVAGDTTLSSNLAVSEHAVVTKTVAAGNTTVTGFINVSTTSQLDGVVTAGSDVDITGEANSATLRSRGIANVDGLFRAKAGAIVTGTANVGVKINVGNAAINTSSIQVGNSISKVLLNKTGINTHGVIVVGGNATISGANVDIAGHTVVSSNVVVGNVEINAGQITVGNNIANVVLDDSGNINADGNITAQDGSFAGTLSSTGALSGSNTASFTGALSTSNTFTANGLSTLKKGVVVTGVANVSSTLNVGGSANVTGAVDFNSTGDFAGNVNFQDSITVADNSSFTKTLAAGNTTVTGFVNATTTGQFGGKITVGGNADITGSMTFGTLKSAIVHTGATANLVSGELYITDTGITATPNTAFEDDVTIAGDLTVQGTTSLSSNNALSLNVANMVTLSVSNTATLDGDVVIGDGAGSESLKVHAPIGNTTLGLIPSANGVPLGSALKRYNAFANSLSVVTITSSSQIVPVSNTSGQVLGTSAKRFNILANTANFTGLVIANNNLNVTGSANATVGFNVGANVNLSTSKLTIGTSSVNTAITSSGIDADGTLAVGGATTLSSTLGVTGAATMSSSANVVGDFSIHSDIKDEGGNAFRVYYANGTVAWPA